MTDTIFILGGYGATQAALWPACWSASQRRGSRFLVGLRACPNETRGTVRLHLTDLFRTYGLPERMLMDNGAPWGYADHIPYTRLTV